MGVLNVFAFFTFFGAATLGFSAFFFAGAFFAALLEDF